MKTKFTPSKLCFLLFIIAFSSCKKDKTNKTAVTPLPVTLGLYEYLSGSSRVAYIGVTQVGTQTVNYATVFDTGSPGLTMDATGILPDAMITASGITVTGDSTVVNGITVTSKTAVITYGDALSSLKEYGNLAYANIKIGNNLGTVTLKRVPFFLYYKLEDQDKNKLPAHSADVFGVSPSLSNTRSEISSPLRFFDYGTNLTNGFKLATLNSTSFSSTGTYVAGLLTIGLTPADLSSGGFVMHPLTYSSNGGYSPNIPGSITYGGTTTTAQFLFDTGTPSVSTIEDRTATNAIGQLPANTLVTLTTNKGFIYSYTTTSTANLTEVQNPNNTSDYRTIFSIDFFIKNEILTDYTNNQIGLKNN